MKKIPLLVILLLVLSSCSTINGFMPVKYDSTEYDMLVHLEYSFINAKNSCSDQNTIKTLLTGDIRNQINYAKLYLKYKDDADSAKSNINVIEKMTNEFITRVTTKKEGTVYCQDKFDEIIIGLDRTLVTVGNR